MAGKVWFGGSRRSGAQRRSGSATGRRLALAFELLERRLLLAASPPDWLSGWSDEAVANNHLSPSDEQGTQFTFPTYKLPDALLNDISTTHFLGVLTNVEPAIVVGDPNGSPAASLSDRIDPNVPTSAFAGVVSVRSVVVTDVGTSVGTCTGTLISATHVLTAAHCVDLDDNGSADISPGSLTIYFNHNNPDRDSTGATAIGVSQINVHPAWTGFNNPAVNDDLTILTLASAAPAGVPVYSFASNPFISAQQIVLAGYGTIGNAIDGYTANSADFFVKRTGQNVTKEFWLDDEGSGAKEVFLFDFDGPDPSTNTLADGLTLGNDIEVTIGGGDSGGPSFLWSDANSNGLLDQGELTLFGVNTFTASVVDGPLAPHFGSLGGGMIANAYLSWINTVIDSQAPTVTSVTASPTLISDATVGSGAFSIAVLFSEAMNVSVTPLLSFPTADENPTGTITLASGAWSNGNQTYTATYNVGDAGEAIADIDVRVTNAEDLAGNALTAVTDADVFSIDTLNPRAASITLADANPTNAASVQFTVTFTESVTNVDALDFALNTSGVAGASITSVSGSGAVYTVTVGTGSGDGTINLDLAASPTINDQAGNALHNIAVIGADETYTINKSNPAVTSVELVDGNLMIADLHPNGKADSLVLSRNDGNIRVHDPNHDLSAGSGVTQIDANTVEVLLAAVAGQIVVDALGGDDLLTIDFAGGNPIPVGGLNYDGGDGADAMVVLGTGTQNVTYQPDASIFGDGLIAVDDGTGTRTIVFTGLEPVDFDHVETFVLDLPGADDVINIAAGMLSSDPAADAIVFTGTSGGVEFEAAHVRRATNVIVDTTTADGDDAITISGADNDHGNTNLTIVTGAGSDNVFINGTVVVAGSFNVQVSTLALNADIDAATITGMVETVNVLSPNAEIQDGIDMADVGGLIHIAQATYRVQSDLAVPSGRTLSITAGTILEFDAGVELNVAGALVAVGDAGSKIVFTSGADSPDPGDWQGIRFTQSQPQSVLQHIEIGYSVIGIQVSYTSGVAPKLLVSHAEIHDTFSHGVSIHTGPGQFIGANDIAITDSRIRDSGGSGIRVSAHAQSGSPGSSGNSPTIARNRIHDNASGVGLVATYQPHTGLQVRYATTAPRIEANHIYGNGTAGVSGIASDGGASFGYGTTAPIILNNLIVANGDGLRFTSSGGWTSPQIVNNTIVANVGTAILHPATTRTNPLIRNNVIVGNAEGVRAGFAFTPAAGQVGFNNVWNNTGGNWTNYPAAFDALTTTNTNGTAADFELNISVDPQFSENGGDPITPDFYRLLTTSPVLTAGTTNAAPVSDFDGLPRVASPDLGAFEVQGMLLAMLFNGTLTISDRNSADNELTVRVDGTDLVISDANEQFSPPPIGGTLSNGNRTLTIPSALVDRLIVQAASGNDVLNIDFTGGNPIPVGGLDYDGGLDSDSLMVIGAAFHTTTFVYENTNDGSIVFDSDGSGTDLSTINYARLQPILSDIATNVVELLFTGGSETISVADAGNLRTTVFSTLGTTTTFTNPTDALRILATNGSDTINVGSLAENYASLFIQGDAVGDRVNINGSVKLGAGKDLTVSEIGTVTLPNSTSRIATIGDGAVNITALRNIELMPAAKITTVNGGITLSANQQATAITNWFRGIDVNGATLSTAGTGDIELRGRGGASTSTNYGVWIRNAAVVESTASGDAAGMILIEGTGGAGTHSNYGVFITDSDTQVISVAGGIVVSGQGGNGSSNANLGVRIQSAAVVSSNGTGADAAKITINGTGGAGQVQNEGVYVSGADTRIMSVDGDILINGQAAGSSDSNQGVRIEFGAVISSDGTGTDAAKIRIIGTGGIGTHSNYGVTLVGSTTRVTSQDGDILITGQGGAGTGNVNQGVLIASALIESTGTGPDAARVTIEGTGGTGTNENIGVRITTSGARITSVDGDIQITGQGGQGIVNSNQGVAIVQSALVTSTGVGPNAATITVNGIGGGIATESHNNTGVTISSTSGRITSIDGSIQISAAAGVGNSLALELLDSQAIQTTGTSDVTVTADSMNIAATNAIVASGNLVTLRPKTPGTQIDLGGADVLTGSPLVLGLTNAEIARITAGTLVTGDFESGMLSITDDITRSNTTNIQLRSGGAIIFNEGTIHTAGGDLLLDAGVGGVHPNTHGTDITAANVTLSPSLNTTINGATADTQYSRLNVAGTVDLSGASLILGGEFPGFAGDQTFNIVTATQVVGEFESLPHGSVLSLQGQPYRIEYDATSVVLVPANVATVVGGFVYHHGSSFANSGIQNAIDVGKTLAKEGTNPQLLDFTNLINTTRGITGLVFDIQDLHSRSLSADDFMIQVSPTGSFDESANPPAAWVTGPLPASIDVQPGTPDRVVITWPNNTIVNRWLRITILATANTGLSEKEVYYVGHLLGEVNGTITNGRFLVQLSDVGEVRSRVGTFGTVSSPFDLDKNGMHQMADVGIARSSVGGQLRVPTIPAANKGGNEGFAGSGDGLLASGGEDESLSAVFQPTLNSLAVAVREGIRLPLAQTVNPPVLNAPLDKPTVSDHFPASGNNPQMETIVKESDSNTAPDHILATDSFFFDLASANLMTAEGESKP